jgi:hypothetical protein
VSVVIRNGQRYWFQPKDEEDDEERRDVRFAKRQQDVKEEPNWPRAVDARGLHKLIGDREEELPEQERSRCRGDQWNDQARIAVQHPQRGDHVIRGQDPNLDRQHQSDEDQPEKQHPEREAEINDCKRAQQRDRDFAEGYAERHD